MEEKIGNTEFLRCREIHAIPQFMRKPEMIPINYVVSSFTREVFDNLIAYLIPGVRYAGSLDAILVFHKVLIRLEKGFLGNLTQWFFFLAPG